MYLFIFREVGKEAERQGEKHWSVVSHMPPVGYLALNPGMCPDQELNHRPFRLWDDAKSTEPHQAGPVILVLKSTLSVFLGLEFAQ